MRERKTKAGKLLQSITTAIPSLAGDVLDVVCSPNPAGAAMQKLFGGLSKEGDVGQNLLRQLQGLSAQEWEEYRLKEYELEIADRKSARQREADMAAAGATDWMMYATGITGLVAFISMVISVIFLPEVQENRLFIHLMGMIEGVVISNLFAYYFGTSKNEQKQLK